MPLILLMMGVGCLPKPPAEYGGRNITVYGFSIMKEPLERSIYPAFSAHWQQEHGEEVRFTSSFAGSETVTNQILQGVGADIAILAIERDAERLKNAGAVSTDWHLFPYGGIINKTPFVILVRPGNPKGIRDFQDLTKPGIKVIHPDPTSSGGAQWSILAIYGSELLKSEKQTGRPDPEKALQMLRAIWRNVIATPGSAREARTQFETGFGDALVTYELEGLLMKEAGTPVEIVIPEATIFSEHPVVIIDRNVPPDRRAVVDAFVDFLWSEEAQRAFVSFGFRSATSEALNNQNRRLGIVPMPFTIDYFGGWQKAYPDIIEGVFRDQLLKRK
jgi:sulfate/thiosulfate transport system substrate-binding protein